MQENSGAAPADAGEASQGQRTPPMANLENSANGEGSALVIQDEWQKEVAPLWGDGQSGALLYEQHVLKSGAAIVRESTSE